MKFQDVKCVPFCVLNGDYKYCCVKLSIVLMVTSQLYVPVSATFYMQDLYEQLGQQVIGGEQLTEKDMQAKLETLVKVANGTPQIQFRGAVQLLLCPLL